MSENKNLYLILKKIQFILVQSCQTHKRQSKAMGPLCLEGGSFISLVIHITQKQQRRAKKKKTKTKELKFIQKRKRSIMFIMDQSNWVFWVFIVDKRLDWSEREGRWQLKHKVFTIHPRKFGGDWILHLEISKFGFHPLTFEGVRSLHPKVS